ncbi:hypothetical protein ACVWY2_006284 [Bradyrhizobium sp. JR6.1]
MSIAQVIRPAPGIASVVSAKFRFGSSPLTKVSEQTTSATKPVATLGTSRARAADSASAPKAVVAMRMKASFRRVTVSSGTAHGARGRDQAGADAQALAGFGIGLAENSVRPRRFWNYTMITKGPTAGSCRLSCLREREKSHTALAFRFRYSVGVTPVVALKARLKGPSDWKPASIAMVMTGTADCEGSASAALASSIR